MIFKAFMTWFVVCSLAVITQVAITIFLLQGFHYQGFSLQETAIWWIGAVLAIAMMGLAVSLVCITCRCWVGESEDEYEDTDDDEDEDPDDDGPTGISLAPNQAS